MPEESERGRGRKREAAGFPAVDTMSGSGFRFRVRSRFDLCRRHGLDCTRILRL